MFKRSIYLDAGLDGWVFTGYKARTYLPFLDLYTLQQTSWFGTYTQLNPFIRATVQSVDVTIRMLNAGYGVTHTKPLVAPGYPSVPRYVEVQVDWKFKN